jgi:hypothetical protein
MVDKMKTFQSKIYGEISEPSSFQELIELTLDPAPDQYWFARMWRGQADIDWPLHSTAYRRLSRKTYLSGGEAPDEEDLVNYEKQLLRLADHRGFRYQDGRRLPDFELLARLRHHGAATRLIDATRNALVGLWFCCSSLPKKAGLLVGVHTSYISGYEGEAETRDYDEVVADLDEEQLKTWEPSPHSPRVAAQHSQFLYSALSAEKTGTLVLPEKKSVLAIAITPQLKAHSEKILSQVFDIRRLTLFPDFDGLSSSRGVDISPAEDDRW